MTSDAQATVPGKPRWTRLAAFGFLLAAAGILVYLIAGAAWRLSGVAFFIPFFVVALVVAYLVGRFGTWSKILGVVLGLGLGFMLVWTIEGIFSPSSFFDFTAGLMILPGALIGLIGSIAALVAKRRGHLSVSAEGGERVAMHVITTVVAVAAVVSGILTIAGRSTASDATAAARSSLKEAKFHPKQYSVPGGSQIFVSNDDPFRHTFTVDALGIDVSFTPGSRKLVTIPATPGTYYLYCTLHAPKKNPGKDDMWATLVVT